MHDAKVLIMGRVVEAKYFPKLGGGERTSRVRHGILGCMNACFLLFNVSRLRLYCGHVTIVQKELILEILLNH